MTSACSKEPFGANGVWWGYFHPGFVGSLDPEPSRCRRTDGKKWRCSRDAVPDQKYCERHINRGRHRSRKPVERHGGHCKASTPSVVSRNHAQSSPDNTSTSHSWMVDHQETTQELYSLDEPFNQLRDYSVANNSLVGPLELYYLQNQTQSHTDCSTIVWTGEGEMQCKRSQVSLSLPMSSPDFSSSTSSPAPETFSPLHMRLGLGGNPNEKNPAEEMNWKPSYWESNSIGGPLGEALTSPNEQSLLSLMNDGWAMSPPRITSSTSNAMQSAAISSVSSSSANDLMVETHTTDGFGCCFLAGANTE
ncbi:hypothetical protein HPP92_028675 [Vanilla planifolia]|uniref:Growth-regulating factor n=1 Tax=Vanilla planifolia TaxID=51239 RepID=A0A835P764_VANPL|nr:hypothetical protein HPP92_028675 [Vanilla planifolia]